MRDVVKEAIAVLRKEGVRIPRSFMKVVRKKTGYKLGRSDLKRFREAAEKLSSQQKLVVGLSSKGKLCFWELGVYERSVKNVAHARKARWEKSQTKKPKEETNA